MAQNLRPIIDEITNKLKDPQQRAQIRDAVLENIKQTRETVEKTLKQVANQTKDSRLVHDYVIPMVESEKADQALKYLNSKLGTNPVVTKLEQARKAIIDLKVEKAKPATEVAEPSVAENQTAASTSSSTDEVQKM